MNLVDLLCLINDVEKDNMAVLRSHDGLGKDTDNIERSLRIHNAHNTVEAG